METNCNNATNNKPSFIKRPENGRPKMTVSDRAKQFAPFAALTGLNKALTAKEKIIVDKPELTEESLEELDRKMQMAKPGKIMDVVYFSKNECIIISGMVAKVELSSRIIQIVNSRISFDDILDINPTE